jgi:hypothetical protein
MEINFNTKHTKKNVVEGKEQIHLMGSEYPISLHESGQNQPPKRPHCGQLTKEVLR